MYGHNNHSDMSDEVWLTYYPCVCIVESFKEKAHTILWENEGFKGEHRLLTLVTEAAVFQRRWEDLTLNTPWVLLSWQRGQRVNCYWCREAAQLLSNGQLSGRACVPLSGWNISRTCRNKAGGADLPAVAASCCSTHTLPSSHKYRREQNNILHSPRRSARGPTRGCWLSEVSLVTGGLRQLLLFTG